MLPTREKRKLASSPRESHSVSQKSVTIDYLTASLCSEREG